MNTPNYLKNCLKLLKGRTITDIWYADDGDHELVIALDNDAVVTVFSDPEQNGYGALYYVKANAKPATIPGNLQQHFVDRI